MTAIPPVPLVLSGGGPKGAFQVGAEEYARTQKGRTWNLISGVSIGALNGSFFSMGRYDVMKDYWLTITPEKVLVNPSTLSVARRLSQRKASLYPIKGVASFVDLVDPSQMLIETRVGAVSLITGEFKIFTQTHPAFKKALLASCAMPLVFPPVDVDEDNPCMTDGAARNYSPLNMVLQDAKHDIVVINCESADVLRRTKAPHSALAVAQRALDIAMHEVYAKDIDKAMRINRMVAQAKAGGVTLTNTAGRPFRDIGITLIEPESWISDIHEYTAKNSQRAFDAGWERAKQVLG